MKTFIYATLLIGFLFVDFLFFHDLLKAGETTSLAQYLAGLLSIPVIAYCAKQLITDAKTHNAGNR